MVSSTQKKFKIRNADKFSDVSKRPKFNPSVSLTEIIMPYRCLLRLDFCKIFSLQVVPKTVNKFRKE